MFWVSPLQYAFTGLVNNEFLGDSYGTTSYDNAVVDDSGATVPLGTAVLDLYGFLQGNKWRCVAPPAHSGVQCGSFLCSVRCERCNGLCSCC